MRRLRPQITRHGALLEGRYSKLNLNLSRQQAISNDLSVYVAASWQAASKNLDPSEKVYLGGAGGVRAYPANEAGGSEGRTLTTELRQRLGERWSLTGFHDYGWVKLNRNPVSPEPAVGGQPAHDCANFRVSNRQVTDANILIAPNAREKGLSQQAVMMKLIYREIKCLL